MNTERIEVFKEQSAAFKTHLTVTNQSPMTIASYLQSTKQFFIWLWHKGIDDVRGVTKDHIRDYQRYLVEHRYRDRWNQDSNKEKSYSVNTIIVKLRALRRLFEYLEKSYQILYNPTVIIRLPAMGDRLPRNIITKDEAKTILAAPNTGTLIGIRDKTILELLYTTGIRLEEAYNLTIYDVDYTNGFLRVNKGKFAKDRIVPLGSVCCKYLREYVNKVRPVLTNQNKDERALFIGKCGRKMNKQIIMRMVRDYAREAGIEKKVSTHTWRHTFASHLVADGADILHVQKLLGHVCPSTTHIYTKVTAKEAKEAHEKYHPREHDDTEPIAQLQEDMPWQSPYRTAGARH